MEIFYISHSIALYRLKTLREIEKQRPRNCKIKLCLDPCESGLSGLRVADLDEIGLEADLYPLRNIRIGRFLWQAGLFKGLFKRNGDRVFVFATTNRCLSMYLFLFLSKAIPGAKCVWWTHGSKRKITGFRQCAYKIFRLFDHIFTYSERGATLLKEAGFSHRRTSRIGNALDPDQQLKLKQEYEGKPSPPCGAFRFLYVGRLSKEKRFDLIFDIVERLSNRVPVSLKIVGNGPEMENIKREFADRKMGGVVSLEGGIYAEEDLAGLFHEADCCISPAEVGLLALHATIYGVPILTHGQQDLQGPEIELLDQIPGYPFAKEISVESFVGTAWQIIENKEVLEKSIETHGVPLIQSKFHPKHQAQVFWSSVLNLGSSVSAKNI